MVATLLTMTIVAFLFGLACQKMANGRGVTDMILYMFGCYAVAIISFIVMVIVLLFQHFFP
jgi:hypothetical protein